MTKDFKSIIRGQIWWVDPGEVCGHLIRKTRPMLIVKEPENQLITVLPITMHEGPNKASHVYYESIKGVATIMCEQIRTVDICQVDKYHGTVSNDIMGRVDEVLSVMLGLTTSNEPKRTSRVGDDTVEKLLQEIPKDYNNMSINHLIDASEARLQEIKSDPEPTKRTRRRWSVGDKLGFLEDSKKMSARELMEKWDLTSNAVHVYKSKFRRELGETVVDIRSRRAWGEEEKLEFLADAESMAIKALAGKWGISQSSARAYIGRFKNVLGL